MAILDGSLGVRDAVGAPSFDSQAASRPFHNLLELLGFDAEVQLDGFDWMLGRAEVGRRG